MYSLKTANILSVTNTVNITENTANNRRADRHEISHMITLMTALITIFIGQHKTWRISFMLLLLACLCSFTVPASAAGEPEIEAAQQALLDIGYAPGPVDGVIGGKTRRAIRAFQRREKLPVTGRLTNQTQSVLFAKQAEFKRGASGQSKQQTAASADSDEDSDEDSDDTDTESTAADTDDEAAEIELVAVNMATDSEDNSTPPPPLNDERVAMPTNNSDSNRSQSDRWALTHGFSGYAGLSQREGDDYGEYARQFDDPQEDRYGAFVLGIGWSIYWPNQGLRLTATIGYESYDTESCTFCIFESQETQDFNTYPINVMAEYRVYGPLHIAGGLTYHLNPELSLQGRNTDIEVEFDNAVGYRVELNFGSEGSTYGLFYYDIEYDPEDNNFDTLESSAYGLHFNFHLYFDR